jgi:hypothetical protein
MSIVFRNIIVAALLILVCQQSTIPLTDSLERIRAYSRQIEFDYTTWTMDALAIKAKQSILNLDGYLSREKSTLYVEDYIALSRQKQDLENQLVQVYSDPAISNPRQAAESLRGQLSRVDSRLEFLGPIAETILQDQISKVSGDLGLAFLGQPVPPLLFHATPLPTALIVSPRDIIQQDANISLQTGLSLEEILKLEERVSTGLNVSALVEEIGGVGTYPTMVQQTSDLNWLTEVIAHEWIHNFLQLRPLGLNYDTNSELRTMNETTASLSGKEIGREVIRQFYPHLLPPPEPVEPPAPAKEDEAPKEPSIPEFDFRAEMHATRVRADELLAQGKIDEAESFMEERRKMFWEHGYQIRKLNQAYFAFHGAYADEPGGAAGTDPVGPAVRELRAKSANLADFINRISWMTSFDQLKRSIGQK